MQSPKACAPAACDIQSPKTCTAAGVQSAKERRATRAPMPRTGTPAYRRPCCCCRAQVPPRPRAIARRRQAPGAQRPTYGPARRCPKSKTKALPSAFCSPPRHQARTPGPHPPGLHAHYSLMFRRPIGCNFSAPRVTGPGRQQSTAQSVPFARPLIPLPARSVPARELPARPTAASNNPWTGLAPSVRAAAASIVPAALFALPFPCYC